MKIQKSVAALALVSLSLTASAAWAEPSSYKEVRERVYARPESSPPKLGHLPLLETLRAWAGLGGELARRAAGTTTDPSDFKERKAKILHPMGICADATWSIDSESPATGLLARGTHLSAIVRLSAATPQTEYSRHAARVFGLAIKIFPSNDRDAKVQSRNVFTLDQNSLSGGRRKSFLFPDEAGEELYFRNITPAKGGVEKALTSILGRFDIHPDVRPLYPLTEVDASDRAVVAPNTPREIRFVPRVLGSARHESREFREEIAQYAAGEIAFDIVLPEQPGFKEQAIGTLALGKPVMSMACDQELHFHHHPNARKR